MRDVKIEGEWKEALQSVWAQDYFEALCRFVEQRYREGHVYPPGNRIFAAFDHCPLSRVKVVILGQDPYHEEGQANGLSFSVNPGVPFPPSLQNIFKEVAADTGAPIPESGDLTRWADQGVLMLNATLTVEAHMAGSHQGRGWERFTDEVIRTVSERTSGVVFILWGSFARSKKGLIDTNKHLVLESAHPSPLSAYRGFFGNHHFSRANQWLESRGRGTIKW